jgi:hypothetical protein
MVGAAGASPFINPGISTPENSTPVSLHGHLPWSRPSVRPRLHIVMKVCPACSQCNAPKAADKGVCGWCAYVPSCEDVEPAVERDAAA